MNDSDNSTTIINTDLKWPVIDMDLDDTSNLLYAFHDGTTISTINTTSGQREDILATEDVEQPSEATAVIDKYKEEANNKILYLFSSVPLAK